MSQQETYERLWETCNDDMTDLDGRRDPLAFQLDPQPGCMANHRQHLLKHLALLQNAIHSKLIHLQHLLR